MSQLRFWRKPRHTAVAPDDLRGRIAAIEKRLAAIEADADEFREAFEALAVDFHQELSRNWALFPICTDPAP